MNQQQPVLDAWAQTLRRHGYLVTPPGFATHAAYRTHLRARNVLDWLGEHDGPSRVWNQLQSCCADMTVGEVADALQNEHRILHGVQMGRTTFDMLKDVFVRHGIIPAGDDPPAASAVA